MSNSFNPDPDNEIDDVVNPARMTEPVSPVTLANLAGQQVGRYRVERLIGSGGVAMVYQAYDQVQGMPVALKVLLPHADEKTYSRFRREALTAGGLRHEHIVRILQVGTMAQGGIAYMAMELVDGETLSELLNSRGSLHPQESCNLLEPIARALDFAHRAGVVHRDVKPSNILLRTASPGAPNSVQLESLDHPVVPLLSDFGVARFLDAPELTSTGRTVGTPAYMAPEQCAGKRDVDGRADIYALGTVLYRCVTGRLPFSGSVTQILHAHVYEPLTIDNEVLQRLPPALVEILRRSLAKDPDERYATAGEMAQALAQAAGRTPLRSQSKASDATATLTLSTATPVRPPATPTTTTVLVPGSRTPTSNPVVKTGANPLITRTNAVPKPASAVHLDEAPAVREARFYRFTWALLPIALAVLILAIAVAFMSSPFGLGRNPGSPADESPGLVTLPSPTSAVAVNDASPTPTLTNTPPIATATPVPATTVAPPATPLPTPVPVVITPAPITATPAATTLPSPTATAPPTPTWTALPTETAIPTDTSTPLSTSTPTVELFTATPTLTPSPILEPSPTLTPTMTATDSDVVTACPTVVDPVFANYISTLEPALQERFRCPDSIASPLNAELVSFQHGLMLRLDDRPELIYIYYNTDGSWEVAESTWQEGEPITPDVPPPPSAPLYVPLRAFGKLWQQERFQIALGYATTLEPIPFPAIKQTFEGGSVLVANLADGQIFAFPADKRRL